jgi:hypothetical protein
VSCAAKEVVMGEMEDLHLTIQKNIKKHGQHVFVIFDYEPPFMYTIGNHERGLPELLFVGDADDAWAGVLNRLGYIMREQRRDAFRDGELVSVGGKFPVKIVNTSARAKLEFTLVVGQYYATDDYRVQQVVLCDTQGKFPGDPECAEPYASQYVLSAI